MTNVAKKPVVVASISRFLKPATASTSTNDAVENTVNCPTPAVAPQSLRQGTLDAQTCSSASVLKAELLWVMKCVDAHYSSSSTNGMNRLFKAMFPDSAIADNFQCAEKKNAYLCTFGLGPYFAHQLSKDIATAPHYVLLFDETLNKDLQEKQMDVYVRAWKNNRVVTKYYESTYMGHATAADLFHRLRPVIAKFGHNKLLQLSMDGPNVNLALAGKKNFHFTETICIILYYIYLFLTCFFIEAFIA